MYPLEGQAQPAILIHSPRTGRDVATSCRAAVSGENFNLLSPYGKRRGALVLGAKLFAISIPSPRTGRDGDFLCLKLKTIKFQSTLPTRGETRAVARVASRRAISIHSPRTGRDKAGLRPGQTLAISIHSPRTGRDFCGQTRSNRGKDFNPLSPHGKRRPFTGSVSRLGRYFNPLFPYGKKRG